MAISDSVCVGPGGERIAWRPVMVEGSFCIGCEGNID